MSETHHGTLTNRERFRRLMRGEDVDRLPVMALEPFEVDAVARWRMEGLPAGADPVAYLGMSRLVHVPLHTGPVPGCPVEVVAEDADSYTERDMMGTLVRRERRGPTMFYGHVDHPVKTRDDWQAYRARFQPDADARLGKDWPAASARLRASTEPVCVGLWPCFFRFGFYSMGMERFLTAFYDDPEMVHEMFDAVGRLTLACLERILDTVVPDVVTFAEDLAGNNGPLVSPATYAEFWDPHQAAIPNLLRERGVEMICMWSAGNLDPSCRRCLTAASTAPARWRWWRAWMRPPCVGSMAAASHWAEISPRKRSSPARRPLTPRSNDWARSSARAASCRRWTTWPPRTCRSRTIAI